MTDINNNTLVSIIMPNYNSAKYIPDSFESVMAQTYTNWELLFVDDCSTDNGYEVAKAYEEKDSRIKVSQLEKNTGTYAARNKALEESKGRYIAYLDSDDIWMPDKLEKQIKFLNDNNYGGSVCSIKRVDEDKSFLNYIMAPEETDYKHLLSRPLTCSSTFVYDTSIIDKSLLVMPAVRAGQDFATWLQVTKAGNKIYGMKDVLIEYRMRKDSISSNKLKAVKRTWNIYRNVEHLSVLKSTRHFLTYCVHAVKKRMPNSKEK